MLNASLVFFLAVACPQEDSPSTDSLIRQLRSSRVDEREKAERTLKLRDGGDVIRALEKASRDSDPEVAARARVVLEALPFLRTLTPNLVATVPGARERLSRDLRHSWTELFLEVTEQTGTRRKVPGITREDLFPLAPLALRGAEPSERARVCALVGVWRLRSAIPDLVPLLEDQEWPLRAAAFEAIEACHARDLAPALLDRLRAEKPEGRLVWINVLSHLGCREVIPEISALLLSPGTFMPNHELPWRLVELDAAEAVPVLIKLTKSRRGEQAIYLALSSLAPEEAASTIQAMLKDPGPGVRDGALYTMRTYPSARFVPAILDLLRNKDGEVRLAALAVLRRIPTREMVPEVRKLLEDDSTKVRREAALLLAGMGDKEGLPELAMLLRDPAADPYSIYGAGVALGREAVPDLLPLLQHPKLAGRAAEALGQIGASEARAGIMELLKSPDWESRMCAACGLAKLDGKKAVPALLPFLTDPDGNVRFNVARQLEAVAPDELIAHFREWTTSGNAQHRLEAFQRLAAMGVSVPLKDLEKELDASDPFIRSIAAGAMILVGPAAPLGKLRALLTDPEPFVRQQAARSLAWLGAKEGLPVLMRSSCPGTFLELNALRKPELWGRWGSTALGAAPAGGHARAAVEAVARAMKVGVEWPLEVEDPNASFDPGYRAAGWTALSVLSQMSGDLSFILEEDRIRVLPRVVARRFWTGWYSEQLLRSPSEEERAEGRALSKELEDAARARAERQKAVASRMRDAEEVRSALSPSIRALPGVVDRLLSGGDDVWTEVFLEISNMRIHKPEYHHLGAPDLDPLVQRALRGALSPDDKMTVLQAVIQMNLRGALPLLGPLLNDSSEGVRGSAARALLQFEGERAIPKVDRLFEDPSPSVRTGMVGAVASAGLRQMVPRIMALKSDPAIRRGVAISGDALGIPETLPYLLEGLKEPEYRDRMQTMWGISALAGPEWNAALIDHMKKETDPQVLGIMIRHFGFVGAREAVPEILEVKRRPQQFLADQLVPDILRTLGQLGVRGGIPVILGHLEAGKFQPEAARVAAEMGLKEAIPLLRVQLGMSDREVIKPAAEALALLGDRDSIPRLRELLSHKDARIRGTVSRCLAVLGDRESLSRMLETARDPDIWGMDSVAALLYFPGEETRAEVLRQFGRSRYLGLPNAWIDLLGRDLLPSLVERLKDESELSIVLNLLARLGTPDAADKIRPYLAHRAEHYRFYAAAALCRVGDREAARYVLSHLSQQTTRIPPLVLNAVCRPEAWKRLDEVEVQNTGYASSKEHCERIAAAAGLELEGLPPSDPDYPAWANVCSRLTQWGRAPTAQEALEQLPRGRWTAVLEPGRLRILGRPAAVEFWKSELERGK